MSPLLWPSAMSFSSGRRRRIEEKTEECWVRAVVAACLSLLLARPFLRPRSSSLAHSLVEDGDVERATQQMFTRGILQVVLSCWCCHGLGNLRPPWGTLIIASEPLFFFCFRMLPGALAFAADPYKGLPSAPSGVQLPGRGPVPLSEFE